MTDEVVTKVEDVVADVKAAVAEPAKAEAAVVASETKAASWVAKHPFYTAGIAVALALITLYAVLKFI